MCLSVCRLVTFVSSAKTAEPIDRDAVWRADLGRPKEPCITWVRDPPREGTILGCQCCGAVRSKTKKTAGLRQPAAMLQTSRCHNTLFP